jgi:polyisoprenoid-binding protein YceI
MSAVDTTKQLAPAGTWNADTVHSNVSFEVAYSGVNAFRGSFTDFSATLDGSSLEGSAKVASVDVKDEQLNGHLQTPDFFDAERYPEITFKATELNRLGGDRVEGSGELTIKGVGLKLETEIDRTKYGVSWNAPNQSGGDYLGNDVKLIAELAFVKAGE